MRTLLKTLVVLLFTVCSFQTARGQSVDLNGEIFEYATYYVNSFDLGTGATNVQIFRYQLSSNEYPVSIKVHFIASMLSPAIGINNEQIIISSGGGSFINTEIREKIKKDCISIWLKANKETLIQRLKNKKNKLKYTSEAARIFIIW